MHEAARRLGTDSSTLRRDLLRAARKIRSKMAPPQDP
jgi:DNA-directed RNA polymerase specialized sigma24 family protein